MAENKAYEAFAPFFTAWKGAAEKANALRTKYRDATKGQTEALDNLMASSDDATLVQWRDFDEKIGAKIVELTHKREEGKATARKHAQTLVPTISAEDAEKIRADYITARKAAHLTGQNVLMLLGNDADAVKAGVEAYGIVEVIGLGGTSTSTGDSGIIRKRLASATIDGEPFADSKGKVTFTSLATKLKVDGPALRDAAKDAANVESVKDIPAGTTVEFKVTVGDKVHDVTITTPSDEDSESSDSEPEAEKAEANSETPAE